MQNLNVGDRIGFENPAGEGVFITACKAYSVQEVLPEGIFVIIDDRGRRLACGSGGLSGLAMSFNHDTWKEWKGYLVRGANQTARLSLPMFPERSGWHTFEGRLGAGCISVGRFERFWDHARRLWLKSEGEGQGLPPEDVPLEWHYLGACLSREDFESLAKGSLIKSGQID